MQLFYAPDINFSLKGYSFNEEESKHCVRVLRLTTGSQLYITDGKGTLCKAQIVDPSPRCCTIELLEQWNDFEKLPYNLTLATAPTKNIERFEWMIEKITEIGVNKIVPILTDHSERKIIKRDRLEKVVTSAIKQSLKAFHPEVTELIALRKIILQPFDGKKFIAHCEKSDDKMPLKNVINKGENILILVGPEGDFSPEEINFAIENGFIPVSLGQSRLRTETAGVVAVHTVSLINQ